MNNATALVIDLSALLVLYLLATLLVVVFGHAHFEPWVVPKLWAQSWKSPPMFLIGATSAGVIAGLGLVAWNPFRDGSTAYGNARWGKLADMKEMGLASQRGIILGLAFGHYVRTSEPLSVLVLAPPGAGKTSGIAIPTLLSCGNSMIICDVKGELYSLTSKRRAQFSRVLKFQPASADTNKWNPFDKAELPDNWSDIVIHVERVATILFKTEKSGDYWVEEGRSVFVFYALYLIHKMLTATDDAERPYVSIPEIRAKALAEADVQGWIAQVLDQEQDLPERVVQEGNSLVGKADKEFSGVFSTFKSKLNVFADDRVRNAMSGTDFNAQELRRERTSLYVMVKLVDMARLRVLLNLLFEMTAATLMSEEAKSGEHYVTFMLDEFVRMGRLDIIKDMPALSRSYKLNVVFIAQDYGQIRELYGDAALTIFDSTTAYKVVFAQDEISTREKVSKFIGNTTRRRRSTSTGRGKGILDAGSRTESESLEGVPLVTPQDVGTIPKGRCIVLAKDYHNRPIKAKTAYWFKDPQMKKLVGSL
jgi:type IV secretion system protein VirD4